ncbi:MAG: hypothetical protein A2534_05360 [Candidatus Magasanikbacteria bacterium RIFOXYD2_FULL_39_9]|nr:MAG: hypothetical protein A2534_05360 [Candidatus Magasanikbacteria bacterium RIFOXYD2_FULL_39_9]
MMAKFGHRAQVRKSVDDEGKPIRYFEHLRGAALILIDEVKIVDAEMIITALLHDSLEDTEDLTPEMIEHAFGSNVVTKVKGLSKIPEEGYLERLMLSIDWEMLAIKGCDRLFNLRDLAQTDEAFRKKQVAETRDHYYHLFDRMVQLTPPQYQPRTTWLRDEIRRVADGQAALLAQ